VGRKALGWDQEGPRLIKRVVWAAKKGRVCKGGEKVESVNGKRGSLPWGTEIGEIEKEKKILAWGILEGINQAGEGRIQKNAGLVCYEDSPG